MEPTLNGLLQSKLKWIFVGGKGGVGKTTTSCSLATVFANTPVTLEDGTSRLRRVLLISTDPAHNLSDAFNQRIGKAPTAVKGIAAENLFAMEIDPRAAMQNYGSLSSIFDTASGGSSGSGGTASPSSTSNAGPESPFATLGSILKNAASSFPGIDELSVFAEILTNVQRLNFDLVLFDTAPTGHTLRMLALPQTLNTTIDRVLQLESLAPLWAAASTMLSSVATSAAAEGGFGAERELVADTPGSCAAAGGTSADSGAGASAAEPVSGLNSDSVRTLVNRWRDMLSQVQAQFNDSEKTCFVCVCIPEFLSVYETERLIQELMRYNISCDSIVVNQLVLKPPSEAPCRMCEARKKVQGKYLDQIEDLYEDFHIVKMPLMSGEVRGVKALGQFGRFLFSPYNAERDGYLEVDTC